MVSGFVGIVPIGMIIDAILFGSALLAIAAARILPEHHLRKVCTGRCYGAIGRSGHDKRVQSTEIE